MFGFDAHRSPESERFGGRCVETEGIEAADIISLHGPMTSESYHLVDTGTLARLKPGILLINTSHGGGRDHDLIVEAYDANLRPEAPAAQYVNYLSSEIKQEGQLALPLRQEAQCGVIRH